MKLRKNAGFFIAIALVIAATAAVCITAPMYGSTKTTFEAGYYFVCRLSSDNAVSAGAVSDNVSSLGGAGYVLNYKQNYYVTIACYYDKKNAEDVAATVKKRNVDCTVLEIKTQKRKAKNKNEANLFDGYMNTLHSLSVMAFDCANKLDTGEHTQNAAKEVVSAISDSLAGLYAEGQNSFNEALKQLSTLCGERLAGFIYSKDMRYLQIALTDAVIKA